MESKRLYRSITDRKFAGVAGGLAEYFVMDPLLIRLAFVILTFAGGGGVLIYIMLWIVTPENPVIIRQQSYAPYGDARQQNPGSADYTSESTRYSEGSPETGTNPSQPSPAVRTTERKKGSLVGGLVLITLGALFLADELIPQININDFWPVILIVIGVGLLINAVAKRNRSTNQY